MEIDMDARTTTDKSPTPLTIRIEHMLTEARVVLPGAQALFGFQLSIVLTRSFAELSSRHPCRQSVSCRSCHNPFDGAGCLSPHRIWWRGKRGAA